MLIKISGAILSATLLLSVLNAQGQNYAESALLFSRTKPTGSARILGIGGANIALGGDYSSALSNPAGLGMYNRSEFTFSPGYTIINTDARYNNIDYNNTRSSLNIPGLSLAFHMPKDNRGFLGGTFAISYSRTNDFNNSITYQGLNQNSSILDYFIEQANGATTDQFREDGFHYNTPTGLAYFNYLIGAQSLLDPPGPNNEYFTDVQSIPYQTETIETKGASNQWSISYGANYDDRFFFGAGLGISSLRYKSNKIFTESFEETFFNSFTLNENLEIRGSGVNVSLGFIARPIDFLQIGLSFTSPTFYNLRESYDASMSSNWNNFDYYGDGSTILNRQSESTDIITSEYNLSTPLKLSTGIAYITKYGFLSADVEFTNPRSARYSSNTTGISYTNENDDIRSSFRSTVNARLGGEFRYEIFRLRAGYGIQSNTFNASFGQNNMIQSISVGAGIRTKSFFMDLAVVRSGGKQNYYPYTMNDPTLIPVVEFTNRVINSVLTVGFTF